MSNIIILDKVNGVAASKYNDFALKYKQKMAADPAEVIYYYFKERDLIVLNMDNPLYEYYRECVEKYVALPEQQRYITVADLAKNVRQEAAPVLVGMLMAIEGIINERERRNKEAEQIEALYYETEGQRDGFCDSREAEESIDSLMDYLDRLSIFGNAGVSKRKMDVEGLVHIVAAAHEKEGFLNGFKYAMSLVNCGK